MRLKILTTLCLSLAWIQAMAQIPAEQLTVETMSEPGPNWFISKTGNGGYIFDAISGEMQGLLSLSRSTPAVTMWHPRQEFYAAESYLSRGTRGERTDIVAIYDFENLSPIAEIIIPNHMARLGVRNHLALTNNGRHLIVHNMNPGHSVSVVDVQDRLFIYELSTPGCAINLAAGENGFLQVCGDGTLQLIELDASGYEENRVRSEVFFDVQDDAIFDRTARSADGWYLITHAGIVFEVTVNGSEINLSDGWNIVPEGEESWRPGGRTEFISAHQDLGLLYVAMHQGGIDTHHENGEEVWVLDVNTQRRIGRIEMETPASNLMVTQEDEPKLIVNGGGIQVYDALTFVHERTIQAPGSSMFEDF